MVIISSKSCLPGSPTFMLITRPLSHRVVNHGSAWQWFWYFVGTTLGFIDCKGKKQDWTTVDCLCKIPNLVIFDVSVPIFGEWHLLLGVHAEFAFLGHSTTDIRVLNIYIMRPISREPSTKRILQFLQYFKLWVHSTCPFLASPYPVFQLSNAVILSLNLRALIIRWFNSIIHHFWTFTSTCSGY